MTGVQTCALPIYISIIPNPANETVNIRVANNLENVNKIEIFDITGNLVLINNLQDLSVDLEIKSFTPGKYFVRIKSGNNYYINTLNIIR